MYVFVTYKNEEDQIKKESARVAKNISHCKPLVIIPDVQGQLTPQSQVRAGGHNFEHQFSDANSVVGGGVGPKFKLAQAFMVVLVTCKNDEDQSLKCSQHFSHYKSMRIFQTFNGS